MTMDKASILSFHRENTHNGPKPYLFSGILTPPNAIVQEATNGHMGAVMSYDPAPKVSIDFNHTPHSSIFAPDQTKVVGGRTVRVLATHSQMTPLRR